MDKQRIDEIRARLTAATPRPWGYGYSTRTVMGGYEEHDGSFYVEFQGNCFASIGGDGWGEPEADLIAHAPDDIADLIAALYAAEQRAEEAERERDELRRQVAAMREIFEDIYAVPLGVDMMNRFSVEMTFEKTQELASKGMNADHIRESTKKVCPECARMREALQNFISSGYCKESSECRTLHVKAKKALLGQGVK